jgi:8-oxo-dGTP pyrophosphatase MutT (NUDIX family)
MLADIGNNPSFVLSAVTGDFGDEITSMYDLAVLISVPKEVRINRIEQRELERHGDRILKGGDMHERHVKFVEFAAARCLERIDDWAKTLTCPIIEVDGAIESRQAAADIANRFYVKPGEPWRVETRLLGELSPLRFVVIFARHKGKWVYARHRQRQTWEPAGGHIELGETPYEAAKRELHEETGITGCALVAAFDYAVHMSTEFSYGRVFFAEADAIGELPESEMAEVRLFDSIPDNMAYPQFMPELFEKLQAHLFGQSSPDEIWDVYDSDKKLTGRVHRRGDPLPVGDYHLVVHIWLMNLKGDYIITRRAPTKHYPLMWETPGGSATAGETSLGAAIREAKEETGLAIKLENGRIVKTQQEGNTFDEIWLFKQDFDIGDVILQDGETIDAKWATSDEIKEMAKSGDFVCWSYLGEVLDLMEGCK